MPRIIFEQPDGTIAEVDVPVGQSVMRGAVVNDIDGILAECGGGAMCGTCHVYVEDTNGAVLPPIHGIEDELLHGTASPRLASSRLSCQLPTAEDFDGLFVRVPERQV